MHKTIFIFALICPWLAYGVKLDLEFNEIDPSQCYSFGNNTFITFEPTYSINEDEAPYFLTLHNGKPKGVRYHGRTGSDERELRIPNEKSPITGIDLTFPENGIPICRENGSATIFLSNGQYKTIKLTNEKLEEICWYDDTNSIVALTRNKAFYWNWQTNKTWQANAFVTQKKCNYPFSIYTPTICEPLDDSSDDESDDSNQASIKSLCERIIAFLIGYIR